MCFLIKVKNDPQMHLGSNVCFLGDEEAELVLTAGLVECPLKETWQPGASRGTQIPCSPLSPGQCQGSPCIFSGDTEGTIAGHSFQGHQGAVHWEGSEVAYDK